MRGGFGGASAAHPDGRGQGVVRAGQFAIIVGQRLWGVRESLEDALALVAEAFDRGALPERDAVVISEISAEGPQLRLVAEPGFLSLMRAEG